MKTVINEYINNLKNAFDKLNQDEIVKCAVLLNKARIDEKTVYIIGNGGSAATASHFVCDFNKDFDDNKKRFKVICLNDNISAIMSVANDMSYDDIFVEQLKNLIEKDDVLIAISGSGNSKNILKAVDFANSVNAVTIGFTGFDGGELKKIAQYSVNANVNNMEMSENIHIVVCHLLKTIFQKFKF